MDLPISLFTYYVYSFQVRVFMQSVYMLFSILLLCPCCLLVAILEMRWAWPVTHTGQTGCARFVVGELN